MKHDTLATRVWCRVRMRGNTPRDLTQPRAALTCPVLQVVNIPSFIVRLDSQKHIDFSLKSPFGGGRPGRVKRKNAKKGESGDGDGSDED